MSFIFKDNKSEKQLAYSWNILVNPKNYFVPRTVEDCRKIDFFRSHQIEINSQKWFFTDKSIPELKNFFNCIYSNDDDIQNTVIYNTVYQSTLREIEIEIICKLESKPLRDFKKAQELAQFRAREVINYFRYLICVLCHQRIYEKLIKIDILSQAFIQKEDLLARETNNGSIIIVSGAGRKNLEKFTINEEKLRERHETQKLHELFLGLIHKVNSLA
ncbi:hypothetical protein CAL7716_080230 [Calothrix sp. PCC 7716]|nr:hypothetical protein CAL7716_080230 [Calothrix sp. PCC 7716]